MYLLAELAEPLVRLETSELKLLQPECSNWFHAPLTPPPPTPPPPRCRNDNNRLSTGGCKPTLQIHKRRIDQMITKAGMSVHTTCLNCVARHSCTGDSSRRVACAFPYHNIKNHHYHHHRHHYYTIVGDFIVVTITILLIIIILIIIIVVIMTTTTTMIIIMITLMIVITIIIIIIIIII